MMWTIWPGGASGLLCWSLLYFKNGWAQTIRRLRGETAPLRRVHVAAGLSTAAAPFVVAELERAGDARLDVGKPGVNGQRGAGDVPPIEK